MESFEFATSDTSVPDSPFLLECPVKDYVSGLMEKNTTVRSICPCDFIAVDFSSFHHGVMKFYNCIIESTNSRSLGAGILATALLYSSWKAIKLWTNRTKLSSGYKHKCTRNVPKRRNCSTRKDSGEPAAHQMLPMTSAEGYMEAEKFTVLGYLPHSNNIEAEEELVDMCENYQRQLKEITSKLESVKFRLIELENDKDLLTAEIDTRKLMIQKLQEENSSERERRQQAELRIEMMNIEQSQIRQLKNEVTVKSAHVDRLEKLMTEKDDLQMRLFSDNVVLPRCVIETRAKEFSDLQNRVHQLQAELDSCKRLRELDHGCQPCRFAKSLWLEDGSTSLPNSHSTDVHISSRKCFRAGTSVALPGTVNTTNKNDTFDGTSPLTERKIVKSVEGGLPVSRSTTSTSLVSPKTPTGLKYLRSQNDLPTSDISNEHSDDGSVRPKNIRVFAQIKNLTKVLKKNNQECDPSSIALLSHLGTLLGSNSCNRIIKQIGNKPTNDKSARFTSTESSDIDRTCVHSASSRRSLCKKVMPLKRLSKYRRDKMKDCSSIKRKLAVQYLDGKARLIGLEDSQTIQSATHENAMNVCTVLNKTECNVQKSCESTVDQITSLSAIKSSDQYTARGGESWIVIIPKDT